MGCPQGSVFGLLLWNIVMDALLRVNLPQGYFQLVYGDNATLVVEGDTHDSLLQRINFVLCLISDRGFSSRLFYSA